jgi:hypothetical protein
MGVMANPFEGLLPLPYLNADEILADEGNRAEFRRLKAACHVVHVRDPRPSTFEVIDGITYVRRPPPAPGGDKYEIIDGGKKIS